VFGLACALAMVLCSAACRGDEAPAAVRAPAGPERGTFALTYYWVEAQPAADRAEVTLYTADCAAVARVSAAFAKDLDLAGTAALADGRVVGIDGDCTCERSPCVHVLPPEQPWGAGVENRPLVPYLSVAVDRALVPIGTLLYIEELDGAQLPGTLVGVHDGCVVADDIGDRITGQHLDWFIGRHAAYALLDARLHLTNVTVREGGARCARR
jgi:3D (Asp-Asp-Asp) domain-containing protein